MTKNNLYGIIFGERRLVLGEKRTGSRFSPVNSAAGLSETQPGCRASLLPKIF
jgi:hypothetical protein